jgi:phage terminase large subunit
MDKSTKIMSSEYDVVYVQEATELTEEDWEAITTRLRNGKISFQQLIADCNPGPPTHWLKVRCDTNKTRMLHSVHEENPILFTADGLMTDVGKSYISKLDNLTGVRHARLRKGQWVAAEGLIYEEFDPTVHLIDRFEIPADWTRWWSVDFGFTNPFVCQMWAEDPDGRLYLYREIYHTRKTVDVHAKDILRCVRRDDGSWREARPRAIICDHDAEGRAVLERELGIGTTPAHKKVTDGIQAVQARLRLASDGKPRLYLMRDALVQRDQDLADAKKPTCTIEEIVGYIWDTGAGKAPKETPKKEDDHGCDAKRYIVAEKDLRGRPIVRWL